MSYEFKVKFGIINEINTGLGGGGGIQTAILVMDYESMSAETQTATCSNMTYDEAKAIASAEEPISAMLTVNRDGAYMYALASTMMYMPSTASGWASDIIAMQFTVVETPMVFYWSADGISTAEPTA